MKLIHRHIFVNVALTCAAAIGLFGFVLMIGNLLRDLLGYLLAGQIETGTFVRLVGLLVPYVVMYALPMGILTGVLLVLGRMSAEHEITAIRASGVSVAGISAPIFFFALAGVAASLAINFQFMPTARLAYQRELADAVRENPLSVIVPQTFIRDFPGKVIYVSSMRGAVLNDVWVWELDAQKRAKSVHHAERGELRVDTVNNTLVVIGRNVLTEVRKDGDPEDFGGEQRGLASADQATYVLPLDRLSGGRDVRTRLKWMTLAELLGEWRRLGKAGAEPTPEEQAAKRMKVQVTIHEKCAMAFSVLSFAVIAIPLGIKVSRKETSANLGVALVLVMGYYFATIVVGWFDNKPAYRPDLLMWLPNIGFQTLGAWLFYRVDRQ